MAAWSGLIHEETTFTASGNSGVIDMRTLFEGAKPDAIRAAWLNFVPADLATDETLDMDLNISVDEHGTADVKIHDFTQVTSTNAVENLHIPGKESVTGVVSVVGSPAGTVFTAGLWPYWKFVWTVGGSTPSMSFKIYGILVG